MDYLQKENESFFDWKIRLIVGKIEKTLDLDWLEIRDILKLDCSGDHLRKVSYGLYEFYTENNKEKESKIFDADVLNDLEIKKIELQKEKEKLRTLKIEFNKIVRKDARFELFFEDVKNSIENIKPPSFQVIESENGNRVGILGISDIHFGKKFESINNSYSIEICKDRLNTLMNEVILWIKDRKIDYLHIVSCGDDIEGLLRCGQIRVLETGVIDSVIMFSKMMANWLNTLSEFIPLTYHNTISSNHTETRFLNVQAGTFPDEDVQKVIVNMINESLKNNIRVKVPIYDTEYIYFTLNNKNIFACHGHQFKGKPVKNIIKELNVLHNIKIDILIIGHLHHEEIITVGENDNGNIKVIILPALMGSDNYSDGLFTGAKAGATLLEINNKKGITTTEVILN